MSEPETKRVKTDKPPYELIYWPGLPGRGEPIRLLFEEAGVPYTDTAKEQDEGEAVSTVLALTSADGGEPVFAVPALRHGDLLLSQTSNILMYLAPKLDLAPSEVGSPATFQLNQIVITIMNGLVEELHDTHHPISVSLTYEDQKPEGLRRGKVFVEERLPKFLAYIQRVIDANSDTDEPWLYGSTLTYADLVLFQCIDGTLFAFPKTMKKLKESGKYDGVFKIYDVVKERPNIKEYLASGRRQAYGNGIWRHYPEMEE